MLFSSWTRRVLRFLESKSDDTQERNVIVTAWSRPQSYHKDLSAPKRHLADYR
jgi:hypothetical protein